MTNFSASGRLIDESIVLRHVDAPVRVLPSAMEIAAAKAAAEAEPEIPDRSVLPKMGDGSTHLDLIQRGETALRRVEAPARRLPTAEEIAAAKAAAEAEPEIPDRSILPKVGDGKTHLDLIGGAHPALRRVEPPVRRLPTAEEIAEARAGWEVEPEILDRSLLPKAADGRTHLDLIEEGRVALRRVGAPLRRLPSAEEIRAAKAAAEVEPEIPDRSLLPKVGEGQTHLDLIRGLQPALRPVDTPARPLPTAEQIAAERAAIGK